MILKENHLNLKVLLYSQMKIQTFKIKIMIELNHQTFIDINLLKYKINKHYYY